VAFAWKTHKSIQGIISQKEPAGRQGVIYLRLNILGINFIKQIDKEAESIWTDIPAQQA
jgi:hypothetical protein